VNAGEKLARVCASGNREGVMPGSMPKCVIPAVARTGRIAMSEFNEEAIPRHLATTAFSLATIDGWRSPAEVRLAVFSDFAVLDQYYSWRCQVVNNDPYKAWKTGQRAFEQFFRAKVHRIHHAQFLANLAIASMCAREPRRVWETLLKRSIRIELMGGGLSVLCCALTDLADHSAITRRLQSALQLALESDRYDSYTHSYLANRLALWYARMSLYPKSLHYFSLLSHEYFNPFFLTIHTPLLLFKSGFEAPAIDYLALCAQRGHFLQVRDEWTLDCALAASETDLKPLNRLSYMLRRRLEVVGVGLQRRRKVSTLFRKLYERTSAAMKERVRSSTPRRVPTQGLTNKCLLMPPDHFLCYHGCLHFPFPTAGLRPRGTPSTIMKAGAEAR
jgi:hypothetical protein